MQHDILIGLTISVVGLVFLLLWRGFAPDRTLSEKAARSIASSVYYAGLFLIATLVLYRFFSDWFIPRYELSVWFYTFLMIALMFQVLCTLFPERGGWMTRAHRTLTGISGISLLPLVFEIAVSESVQGYVRVVSACALVAMAWLLLVALRNQKGYRYALLLQAGYYGAFFVVILAATYL